jgi:two-component system response regulator QseB
MRILVIEDDAGISRALVQALRREGWAPDVVGSISTAMAALHAEPFQMVLLDLGLPDGDGREVLRRIRLSGRGKLPDPETPVLIMTARDQVESRISGLDMGADDYITKPFDSGELGARIRALRRRSSGRASPTLKWGHIEVDPAARTVSREGKRIDLSPREFGILLALLEASPRVLSKHQLEAHLYDWEGALESNAIEVHVHRIRKKIGEAMVVTMRGVGYFIPSEPTQ